MAAYPGTERISRHLFDDLGNFVRCGVVEHVTRVRNDMEGAALHFLAHSHRLVLEIDDMIVLSGDEGYRHG
jgi:hypothetical protein